VGRLVPIKRVDVLLRAVAHACEQNAKVKLAIVGDGELRARLEATPTAPELAPRLAWAGFRRDIPDVCFASDLVALTSDNEGTPVSLIEAQAAGVQVVSARVGGAATVVLDGETGRLAADDDEPAYVEAVLDLLTDPVASRRRGRAGREHVLAKFSIERLLDDIDRLYRTLIAS
jgi:glycosyltransferase involved in cell wall biosynthesis